jgi:hypothetical protein
MCISGSRPLVRLLWMAAVLSLIAGCSHQGSAPRRTTSTVAPTSAPDLPRKIMIVAEENHGYDEVVGSQNAPYLNHLAAEYGIATNYDAGYPAHCPSLAAYVVLTSGTTGGICDDRDPKDHPLTGDNIFRQVAASGEQWRNYAESAPAACALTGQDNYLVRHVPATYYVGERGDCRRWAVPLGSIGTGALHDDVAAGTLPAYAFVSPDACHDMHGAPGCPKGLVAAGDQWLSSWLPRILAGPDYRAGRLTVIITWDEGTSTSNHIPTLAIAAGVHHVTAVRPLTHCSTLRFTEEQLHLPLLGCAASATSLGPAFGL